MSKQILHDLWNQNSVFFKLMTCSVYFKFCFFVIIVVIVVVVVVVAVVVFGRFDGMALDLPEKQIFCSG